MFLNYSRSRAQTWPSASRSTGTTSTLPILFFSGGADPMWATRRAGVFLLAMAVLLPCGICSVMRHGWSLHSLVLLVGFLFAPVPIVIALPEAPQYATARDLLVAPVRRAARRRGCPVAVEAGTAARIAPRRSSSERARCSSASSRTTTSATTNTVRRSATTRQHGRRGRTVLATGRVGARQSIYLSDNSGAASRAVAVSSGHAPSQGPVGSNTVLSRSARSKTRRFRPAACW